VRTGWLEVTEAEGGLIVHDPVQDAVHHLNPSAAAVFDLCDGTRDPEAIAADLAGVYGLEAPPTNETRVALEQLAERCLVRWDARPRPVAVKSLYDPATFWSGVAWRLRHRGIDPDLSGSAGPFHRYKHQVSLLRLFDLLPLTGATVLEFGCGPGGNLRALSERGPTRLVGADTSPEMVKLARQRSNADVVQLARSGPLPFNDEESSIARSHMRYCSTIPIEPCQT
jgi:hypothetical protein